MLIPSGATVAEFNSYIKSDNPSHVKIEFGSQGVILTDNDIDSTGIRISTYMNSKTDLVIGSTTMTEVSIPLIRNNTVNSLRLNTQFTLYFGVEDGNGTTKWVQVGIFNGEKPDIYQGTDVINFVAYDNMKKFNAEANEFLRSYGQNEVAVRQFLKDICDNVDISISTKDDPSAPEEDWYGDMLYDISEHLISPSIFTNNFITFRRLVEYIAEASGCYAIINSVGELDMRWFRDQRTVYTLDGNDEFVVKAFDNIKGKSWEDLEAYTWEELEDYQWIDFEDAYNLIRINGVKIQNGTDDVGVFYPENVNGNIYVIADNPIISVDNSSYVDLYVRPLYQRLSGLPNYLPITISCVGNPLVETGDIINATINDETVVVPIFSIVRTWNSSIDDMYEVTGQLNRDLVTVSSEQKMNSDTTYHTFRNNYSELYSEIHNKDGHDTVFNQTNDKIEIHVENQDEEASISISGGTIEVEASNDVTIDTKDIEIQSSGSVSIEATDDINVNTQELNIVSESLTYDNDEVVLKKEYQNEKNIGTYKNTGIEYRIISSNDTLIGLGTFSFSDSSTSFTFRDVDNYETYFSLYKDIVRFGFDHGLSGSTIYMYNTWKPDGATNYSYHASIEPAANNSGYLGRNDEERQRRWYEVNSRYVYCDTLNVDNSITANSIFSYQYNQRSSREVKHDINSLGECGEVIDKLKPVSFIYNADKDNRTRYGLIYEDTIEFLPEICNEYEGNKSLNYIDLIPILLKEVQSLRHKVAELEDKLNERG